MKRYYCLALALLLLVIPHVAAADTYSDMNIIIDDNIVDSYNYHIDSSLPSTGSDRPNYFRVEQSENYMGSRVVLIWFSDNIINNNESIHSNQTAVSVMTKEGTIIGNGTLGYYRDATKAGYIFLDFVWEVPQSGRNTYLLRSSSDLGTFASYSLDDVRMSTGSTPLGEMSDTLPAGFYVTNTGPTGAVVAGDYTINTFKPFRHIIEVSEHSEFTDRINVYRVVDGTPYGSMVSISGKSGEYLNSTGQTNIEYYIGNEDRPYRVAIYNMFGKWYEYHFYDEITTPTPTQTPGVQPVLRTGTVTMTDHNGTTISGFDVRAVNHYTGEEYTVSTGTDVAVMTLPMDRTIEIRNPQTGVYEEAPIGYYRFYGYKSGYKMLNEDGIQVSVMPEKYGSYQLCDILVTSDTGYLTGKHQFQLRSRSDYSILQTGTISAQSATTGEWYNTTVSNGIATLILPYDTSDALSKYAGHYYVYATSPGYEDSDYGTQIAVYPHTVSEIRTILLTPIGGVPVPGNVTLRIQAFSETGHGIPNAEIFIAGVLGAGKDVWNTYTASSTGYLEVSVPGNSTYDIVASGAGYYDSARRVQVFDEDPGLIEIKLYLSGAPTVAPTTQPTGWITTQPTTQPTGGIPDEDDGSESFLMVAVRGIGKAFGVGFATAKLIFGALLALAIGFATAKQLRGGAAEFGLGLLGGTMLGVLIGLLPVWIIVVLLLVVGLYIGHRYVGGGNNG